MFEPEREVSVAPAAARCPTAATTPLTSLVAIAAKHRTVTPRLKRYGGRLSATGADHWSTLRRSRTETGTPPLIVFLCGAARLAPLWCRITAFLKERLVC